MYGKGTVFNNVVPTTHTPAQNTALSGSVKKFLSNERKVIK